MRLVAVVKSYQVSESVRSFSFSTCYMHSIVLALMKPSTGTILSGWRPVGVLRLSPTLELWYVPFHGIMKFNLALLGISSRALAAIPVPTALVNEEQQLEQQPPHLVDSIPTSLRTCCFVIKTRQHNMHFELVSLSLIDSLFLLSSIMYANQGEELTDHLLSQYNTASAAK